MRDPAIHEPVVLALDVGTSSARAALFDARGYMLPDTLASRPHSPRTTQDGGSELDSDTLLEDVCSAVDETLAAAAGVTVTAVGTTSFWHSIIGVDPRGEALTPVYTWADTRARVVLPEIASTLDTEALYDRTACPLHSSYVPPKLLWLRRTRPDLFGRVRRWLSPGEYVHLRLLGETACGEAMASATGMYDQEARTWYEPALDTAGITPDELAPLVSISQPIASLRREYASRWPALASATWYPAVGDGATSNFGSGAARPGVAALNYGTSAAIRTVVAQRMHLPRGLWLYRVDAHRLLLGGAVSNAGNVYAWLLRTLGLTPEEAEEYMLRAQPGTSGLDFVPHLAGERAPDWQAGATGTLSGIRLDTSREEILQAGVEGVLVELLTVHNMLVNTVEVRELIVSGGAVRKSEALRKSLTDALGRPLRVSLETEPSARGAALLALEAIGAVEDAAQVPARTSELTTPDQGRHGTYASIERARTARRPGYRTGDSV